MMKTPKLEPIHLMRTGKMKARLPFMPRARQTDLASARIRDMKLSLKMRLCFVLWPSLVLIFASGSIMAQTAQVFRFDGGDSTYAFGVNERGELYPLSSGGGD